MQKIILSNFLLQVTDRTKNVTFSYFLCHFVQILSAGISLGSSGQQGNIDRETEKIVSIFLQKKIWIYPNDISVPMQLTGIFCPFCFSFQRINIG